MESPDRKVNVGLAAGGLIALLVWAAKEFGGVTVTAEAAIGATALITFALQYFVRNKETP